MGSDGNATAAYSQLARVRFLDVAIELLRSGKTNVLVMSGGNGLVEVAAMQRGARAPVGVDLGTEHERDRRAGRALGVGVEVAEELGAYADVDREERGETGGGDDTEGEEHAPRTHRRRRY